MEKLPTRRDPDPEVLEPEIVGVEPPPPPFWQGFMARAAFSLILAGIGAVVAIAGVILTLTILGAFIGIPLIILGLFVFIGALLLPLTRGRVKFVSLRWPPR